MMASSFASWARTSATPRAWRAACSIRSTPMSSSAKRRCMRKLAIVGYGKMGKLIEQLAPEYDFDVALKLDEFNNVNGSGLTAANFKGVDVAIEFSIPSAVAANVAGIAAQGVPVVVGTTGWLEHLEQVKQTVLQH